ncbi:MAG: FprA family A-type flavoprotein [Candidatus Margulisiibacteriota bacterium]
MKLEELVKDIYYVGAPHPERQLFDELIPLPDGTSYNAYLIKGKTKIALLDTVDPTKESELLDNLRKLKVDRIDYVIAHHCEQDHSGSIPTVLDRYPMAKVVTNPKCKAMLKDHLLVAEDKFIEVKDGQTLDLGGRTLQFIYTPWVHWPETICTYLKEDQILFSCDFFGSHIALSDLFVKDKEHVYLAAKRYYAEIMMPFRVMIKNNLKKLAELEIKMIAPSHGPVHDKPGFILDAYNDWISDKCKNEVVVAYVSMHGSTAVMANYLVEALEKKNIQVKAFNLAKMDLGELAMALVDAATVIVGTPTVLVGPHPAAVYTTYLFNALRPKTKYLGIIGSFGWGGKMVETLSKMLTGVKVEVLEPVVAKGYPKDEDFKKLDQLVAEIVEKHKGV